MLAERYNKSMDNRNFLASTDFPMDKVSGYDTGSVSVTAFNVSFPEVNHGLGYRPLYFIKWSTDPTFSTSYDEVGVSFNFITLSAQTDATKLYLFINNLTGGTVTIYYRVIYYMPTDVDLDISQTQAALDNFSFNTDYNYPKIFAENVINAGTGTVNHNLGYYPQVEAWYIRASDGKCIHVVASDVTNSPQSPRAIVTTTQVIFENSSFGPASAWHYKIYLDEV